MFSSTPAYLGRLVESIHRYREAKNFLQRLPQHFFVKITIVTTITIQRHWIISLMRFSIIFDARYIPILNPFSDFTLVLSPG